MEIIVNQIKYDWEKEAWFEDQKNQWRELVKQWNFFTALPRSGCIGLGMRNGKTEAVFYLLDVGTPEQIHTTILSFCKSFAKINNI